MEADMQSRLVHNLLKQFGEEADTASIEPDRFQSTGKMADYAEYKRGYVQRIHEEGTESGFEISRVRTEVNTTESDDPNEQIDVAVFDPELGSVQWNDGSKRYERGDLQVAFELKFVKNQNVLSSSWDVETLKTATEVEARADTSHLDKTNRKLQQDIARLKQLDCESYLIIFSNYNYLFQPELLDDEDSAYTTRGKRIGWSVDAWFTNEATCSDLTILYAHPGGITCWPGPETPQSE
jgi:hypothetical protein